MSQSDHLEILLTGMAVEFLFLLAKQMIGISFRIVI